VALQAELPSFAASCHVPPTDAVHEDTPGQRLTVRRKVPASDGRADRHQHLHVDEPPSSHRRRKGAALPSPAQQQHVVVQRESSGLDVRSSLH
jgi:hypothetical protein